MELQQRPHERWIWTELIGFDNSEEDLGVGSYIETAGFVPTAICLLMTSPDFVLSHEGVEGEVELPPDFCARDGHDFNPHRQRQVWTNTQLRGLIDGLHSRGIEVYLTVFTRFYGNAFHHEWISDHREVCMVFRSHGWASALNVLSRLDDGTYFEDYFSAKLVEVMEYYGFDGWHGADGYGPLNGPIWQVCVSDDMIDQFAAHSEAALPEVVTRACGHEIPLLEERAAWLWRHARHEWIEFWVDRWTRFWQTMVDALHGAGKKAVVNSAWGRAPFEARYRYGVDYKRIAETGIDGIIVETAAAGLWMDPRVGANDKARHFDFLSMLMLIRAYVPDTKLIFLHNTHDTVEEWDAVRHIPTVLEKEIYSLANVFHTRDDGSLIPCADGFLVCLGDGLDPEHWRWLRKRWALAFSDVPQRVHGATLVWSDAALEGQRDEFTETRTQIPHGILFQLMTRGAPVQSTVRADALDGVEGALLVINPHLFAPDEQEAIRSYERGPVIAIGQGTGALPAADFEIEDTVADHAFRCAVYGASLPEMPGIPPQETSEFPADVLGIPEPRGYWDYMTARPVSDGFLDACAATIASVSGDSAVTEQAEDVAAMVSEYSDGTLCVAIKNKTLYYVRPTVDVGRPIGRVDILTEYPSLLVRPDGSRFSIRVPGSGLTVVRILPGEADSAD